MEISAAHKEGITIVVVGDRGTGKSSLIRTAVSGTFPTNVAPVLPPARLPDDMFPARVPVTVIDTSVEQRNKLEEELRRADAIVLTYAADRPETLDRLSTYWFPELRQVKVRVPVIVVGCKLDLRNGGNLCKLDYFMSPIMQQFLEIDTCIECSACRHIQIAEVFYYAQKAILYPTPPLVDEEIRAFRPQFVKALRRIFILCDHDEDGALSDAELNEFQVKCFNAPLQPSQISSVKRLVQQKLPAGVDESGLTLRGFLFLHALLIEKWQLEVVWTVLRKFGYNNDIRLDDGLLPPSFKRAPDQSVELTNDAVDFLKGIFHELDYYEDGRLRPSYEECLFSTAPDCPWNDGPCKDAMSNPNFVKMDGFLSQWALMTLLEPAKSVEYLKYLRYGGDASSAIRLTRRRLIDRQKGQSERNVYQCFVFGPNKAGKSALLNDFQGRHSGQWEYHPSTEEWYAVNAVDGSLGGKKFLVLREIPEDRVKMLLSDKDSLAACDVAIFVYNSSDELSWKKTAAMLVDVASHGEDTGYGVPSLIVATEELTWTEDCLIRCPTEIHDSTLFCQDMGIEPPISANFRCLGREIFRRIVSCAEHPHLSIPETEAGRSRKQYRRFVHCSLMRVSGFYSQPSTSILPLLARPRRFPASLSTCMVAASSLRPYSRLQSFSRSVGAVAIVGSAAFHVYAARRHFSR